VISLCDGAESTAILITAMSPVALFSLNFWPFILCLADCMLIVEFVVWQVTVECFALLIIMSWYANPIRDTRIYYRKINREANGYLQKLKLKSNSTNLIRAG
jgi:hypothetical protein